MAATRPGTSTATGRRPSPTEWAAALDKTIAEFQAAD